MRNSSRAFAASVISVALLVTTPSLVNADEGTDGLPADQPSTFGLPDGGTVVFNPTDPVIVGATVDIEALDTEGATAESSDGVVVAIGDGVEITAKSSGGEDISVIEHDVVVTPASEDAPAIADITPAIELTFPLAEDEIDGLDLASLGVYSRESADEEWTWVPSAYDPELGAVVAQSDHLSEFVVMGAPSSAASTAEVPRIALDPDDAVGRAKWSGTTYNELQFSYAVALAVKSRLEEECGAEVLITRDASTAYVNRSIRANLITNFGADIAMTLAFNTYNTASDGVARPWGVKTDGGVVAWSANNPASIALGNSIKSDIKTYTGRSDRRRLNSTTTLPYAALAGSAPAYAHAELLFLDHNYDWPVISTRRSLVEDAVYASLIKQIEATPGIGCAEPVTLPAPPTQEVINELTQMGKNNYQVYGTDPVNLSTGNFVSSEEVFKLTGVGDQVMDLTLAYNALDGRESPVGNGWNFAFGSRVQQFADGSVLATLADGRRVNFTSNGHGGFLANAAGQASLVASEGGVTMTFPDGTSLVFAVDAVTGYGSLVRAIDRQGNAYTLTYGALPADPGDDVWFPPLTSITDEAGQVVKVTSTPLGRITAFTHPDGRVWRLGYDDNGHLTSVTDGAGRVRSFTYNDKGLLAVVTGADGVAEVTNTYDDVDRVVTQTDGAGSVRTIAYSADRSTSLTDALGYTSVVEHNAKGQATATHDAAGGVTRTGYDANFNPVWSLDANGNIYLSTFDAFGRVLSTTSPLGEVTSYTYNTAGDLTSVTTPSSDGGTSTTTFVLNSDGRAIETHFPDGTVTYATFDAHGDITSTTDALGDVTRFRYDNRGNTVEIEDPLGGTSTAAYDLANRVTSTTDELGRTTSMSWDGADNLTSVTDALGQVTTFVYDANDSLISQTDVRGRATTFEYNVNLQPIAVTYPDGSRVTFEYDAEHHLVSQTNPDGTTRDWEYDALGRATAMVDEAGGRWVTVYDAIGNAIATIDPTGVREVVTYDALGRAVAATDELGNTSATAFNAAGLVESTTDALGHTTSFTYDDSGRLLQTTRADGTTTSLGYDANGRLTSQTDARGFTTAYEYDAVGQQTAVIDALGGRTTTAYDLAGNVTSVVDALGHESSYAYDALNRLTETTDALGGTLGTVYDPAGNVLSSTDALGRVTGFTYDAMSRLATTTLPDGAVTAYAYNAVGDLVSTTDALGGVVKYEYDATGRETARIDEAGERWTTEYDAAGRVLATADPLGARTAFEYDAAGRAVATVDALGQRTALSLDAVGAVTGSTDPLGRVTSYAYDAMGRVASVTSPDGGVVNLSYDADGNLTAATDARGFTTSYEYDALSRQVAGLNPLGGRATIAYDALGNVTSMSDESGAVTTFAYDALSRPVAATDALGGETLTGYDAVGNIVSRTDALGHATTSTYDGRNRLVALTLANGSTTAYAYDALGREVSVTDAIGEVTSREYDAVGREVARVDESGARWLTEYDAVGNPIATVDPTGARSTMEYDLLGQQTASTDAVGARTEREFDAAGQVAAVTDALGQRTSYTYDAMSRLLTVTTPQGAVTTFGYDANGNTTLMRNALGAELRAEYDALNRTVAQVDPDGGRTVTSYDPVGRVLSVTDAVGAVRSYTYDAIGRVTSSTDGEGFTTRNAYDAVGNLLTVTDPEGGVQRSTYDVVNRPVTVTDAEGATTSTSYDAVGRVATTTDAAGIVKRYAYDDRGLLTSTTENFVESRVTSATVNVTTSTAYDTRGLATSTTDPRGNTTTYTRDAAGRLVAETDALGRRTATTYDALGRPTAVTAADGTVTRTTYSADGFATKIEYPGSTVTSTYDAIGRRLTMKDSLGTSKWVYDWAGRVTEETDARGKTQVHEFDAVGNEVATEYSDGRTVTRVFDARGLVVSKTDLTGIAEYDYDGNGRLVEAVLPSGVVTSYDRDKVGRVTSLDHVGLVDDEGSGHSPCLPGGWHHGWGQGGNHWWKQAEPTELRIDYVYDARGLVSSKTTTSEDDRDVVTYTHDALGRLVKSASADDTVTYRWDAASNLVFESHTDDVTTSRPRDAFSVSREVDAANQLVRSVSTASSGHHPMPVTTSYGYDARGNRTSETTTVGTGWRAEVVGRVTYAYDGRDDLVSVVDGGRDLRSSRDDEVTRFVRDGVGRALTVVEGCRSTSRLFDGLEVVAEGNTQLVLGPLGGVESEVTTTWSGHGRWGHWESETQDVLADALGSPVGIATDGVVSEDVQTFGDFGEVTDAPEWDTVTGFTGRPVTAGLVEFATRSFEPASRVWLQSDTYRGTTTRASSLNRYAYVEGAPETFVDHLGFFRAAAAIQAQKLAALQAAFASAFDELAELAGWFAEVGTSWSAKQMLAHYTTYYASDNPAVRDAMAKIARNAFDNVATFVNQQNMQDALGQVAYQYRLREAERQQQLYEINLQYQADMAAIQAENDALLFYHTVNQTATVLKDPSFATHTVLDVVGLIPVVGEPADLLNSVIYLAEGNYLDASLSAAGAIPFAGWAASGAQIVKNTYRAANAAMEVADTVSDGIRLADNVPLSAATPPASTITTFDPVPPMVKMPEAPIALPKTPDVAPPLKQIEPAPVLKQIEAAPVLKQIEAPRSDGGTNVAPAAETAPTAVIRNSQLAGGVHPTTGIPFDSKGFPDFTSVRHPDVPDVKIEPTGSRAGDVKRANEAAGLDATPEGYTWHHNQEPGVMQLVDREVHAATGHTGGFALWGRLDG